MDDNVKYFFEKLQDPEVSDNYSIPERIQEHIYKPYVLNKITSIVKDKAHPSRTKIIDIINDAIKIALLYPSEKNEKTKEIIFSTFKELAQESDPEIKNMAIEKLAEWGNIPSVNAIAPKILDNVKKKTNIICTTLSSISSRNDLNDEQWGNLVKIINSMNDEKEMRIVSHCLYERIKKIKKLELLTAIIPEISSDITRYAGISMLSPSQLDGILDYYHEALKTNLHPFDKRELCEAVKPYKDDVCRKWVKELISEKKNILSQYSNLVIRYADNEIKDILYNRFQNSDKKLQGEIIILLASIGGSEKWRKILTELMHDQHAGFYAAIALLRMGEKSALPVAIEGLKKIAYYKYLSSLYDAKLFEPFAPEVITDLRKLLDYPNEDTQEHVTEILIMLKDETIIAKIKKSMLKEMSEN